MKIVSVTDNQEMSKKAAEIIRELVLRKPDAVLGLATGGTPEGTYQQLVKDHQENGTSYRSIRTVNLDEYAGIDPKDPNSYYAYMKQHFFDHVDLPDGQYFLPNGLDTSKEACMRYDALIDSLGGVDLQLLGIGRNGHIGFNEPGSSLTLGTHVVKLTESTRHANARYFGSIEDVPTEAVTMGIGTILKSRKILLIASGEEKADALGKLVLANRADSRFPASALTQHKNVIIIADEAALSQTKVSKD
ncbi:glucosamine-6-phosphate deaminase [Sporolactobacillus inulinus]|uniref:Glucosamine-6-phosphate deaminase n=1 Tax=Sporolactobacillus inulinus CASD TaxID=1069536 RepID=A0A0U1QLQ4_9BACL|nr:glucosamine-6-phosphate deaminase [Sporolactobacillus inulinus]KLI01703.1 glucosamine-6-phosphate deaminase [Sporolactobacillus inulinus CASD]GEB76006.1 glucosamine-6-phosphate deaminase 1 [Sporolactobacillus inulinus]